MTDRILPETGLLAAPPPGAHTVALERETIDPWMGDAGDGQADDFRLQTLIGIITARSIVRNSKKTPILSTRGVQQRWLIDLRKTFLDPVGLDLIAELFWERFIDKYPFQVGGLEVGSVPLTSAIQLHGLKRGLQVNGFIVRKERKTYGLTKTYEGQLTDDPIVVVDDLLNSAETAEKVRVVLAQAGRSIRDLFVVIDYQNPRGQSWVERTGVRFESLFTLAQFGLTRGGSSAVATPSQSEFAAAWDFSLSGGNYFDVLPGSTPALDQERLYFGSDSGVFWALDQTTGTPHWKFEVESAGRKAIRSSPAVHQGRVYFGSYEGNVYCLDAASGREHWRFGDADWVGSSPMVAPDLGMLFIGLEHAVPGRGGSIAALQLATGSKVWEFAVKSFVHGSPAYDQQLRLVACGTNDSEVLLFEPLAPSLLWRFAAGGDVKASPAFDRARNAIVVGAIDGSIHSIDIATGRARWTVKARDMVYSTPLVEGDRIYVASADKNVYVLRADDGNVLFKISTTGKNYSSPRSINGRIYFGSTSGIVYEFDPVADVISGQIQFPERITNPVVYSGHSDLFYARSYDGKVYAFRKLGTATG